MNTRTMPLELHREQPANAPENVVRVIASTNRDVSWGQWSERLLHAPENVDTSAARSVLFNHNRENLIGGIRSVEANGEQLVADLEIDPEARAATGVRLLPAIRSGYVRGISIGYEYAPKDCDTIERDGVTSVTVKRWALREISITPTPADTDAQVVRSLPAGLTRASADSRAADQAPNQEEAVEKSTANPIPQGADAAEQVRQAESRVAELVDLARSHKVDIAASELVGCSREDALVKILRAKASASAVPAPEASVVVDVIKDSSDKAREAAEDGLMSMIYPSLNGERNLGMRCGSILELGRRMGRAFGHKVDEFSKLDMARYLLGKDLRVRGAANVTTDMFSSYVLANVMDKVVMKGFIDYPTTYEKWVVRRSVADFKSFTGAALATGNLKSTAENVPFEELTRGEGGYSDSLGMWGGTLSLTMQALVNDDLGEFSRSLARSGAIAKKTIEKQVYTKLAAATWTNHVQTSGSLASSTLDTARKGMMSVTDPAGEIVGIAPRFLIVPSGIRTTALQLTVGVQNATTFNTNTDLETIVTPYLTTATTASQSTWYLAADPAIADTLVVATLNGVESPLVEEFDAGAVAARKWKIMLPFVATVPTGLYGMYQSKHA